jgi:hypothetical protein
METKIWKTAMDVANRIRSAMERVAALRRKDAGDSGLMEAVHQVKELQSRRFEGSYPDLFSKRETNDAATFFLNELYGAGDFSQRDAQFARIAGAVESYFPKHVGEVAAELAELHALTEDLDHAMASHWSEAGSDDAAAARYVDAWREVGRRQDRQKQLEVVMTIGADLARLTRLPGLRLMLKMMRGPASAAGLSALQAFLEKGFDTFAQLSRSDPGARNFLGAVRAREDKFIALMFDVDRVACETELERTLGQAR